MKIQIKLKTNGCSAASTWLSLKYQPLKTKILLIFSEILKYSNESITLKDMETSVIKVNIMNIIKLGVSYLFCH